MEATDLHVPAITPNSQTNLWSVYCIGCSEKIQDYVFPCKEAGRPDNFSWPSGGVPTKLEAYDRG